MYLDFLVKVPTVKGKITRRKKSNVVYIEYEYDRVYDPSRKYTFPKRVTVSYTHLDVYKRQVIDVKEDEIILNIGYKADGIITKNEYSNDASLVLDVYKRQLQTSF